MSDKTTPANSNNGEDRQQPPMFYWRPAPLTAATHAAMKIRPEHDYGFAARTNAVPVTAPEFVLAARHYPIIFVGPNHVPSVALGFKPDENVYIDADGRWERLMYVPAYVQRYPFILVGNPGDERLQLAVDEAAGTGVDGARALFEDTKETQTVRDALSLCEQFHNAYLFTNELIAALTAKGLIEERNLEIQTSATEKMNLGTFSGVNEQKFRDLDDETAQEWRKRGFLHAIYFHLQSLNNWEAVLDRANRRAAPLPGGPIN